MTVWIKIKSSVQDIFDKTKDLYLCALYIPPSNSPYYSDDIFVNLQDDIMNFGKNEDCILLVGDMNGRSARIHLLTHQEINTLMIFPQL